MKTKLYPLKFKPILKEKIWGGQALNYKSKDVLDNAKIGESWELSGVRGSVSTVENGLLKGCSLNEILQNYNEDLVGKSNYKRFGNEFPLLIKFIDAKEHLSVQLHPDDSIARAKHDSMGKTEMWYIMQAEKDGMIIADFKDQIDQKTYIERVKQNTIQEALRQVKVKPGDVYFIAPGLIHAIGAGVMLAEIQQTSDITYRIYDWDRVDDQGKGRDLHQEEALDAIDFTPKRPKIEYSKHVNTTNKVVYNPYFKTDFIEVRSQFDLNLEERDSFTILMNVGRDAILESETETFEFKHAETYLIPASISDVSLRAETGKFLMVHI